MYPSLDSMAAAFRQWSQPYQVVGAVVSLPQVMQRVQRNQLPCFSSKEQEALHSIENNKRRISRIGGRLAAREALRQWEMQHVSDACPCEILNDSAGQPYFSDFPDLHLSITHSGSLAAAVISEVPVGLDLERGDARPLCLVEHFFSQQEQIWILEKKDQMSRRIDWLWTRKEALVKLKGVGARIALNRLSVLSSSFDYVLQSVQRHGYTMSLAVSGGCR